MTFSQVAVCSLEDKGESVHEALAGGATGTSSDLSQMGESAAAVMEGVLSGIPPLQSALPAVPAAGEISTKLERFKSSVIQQVSHTRRPSKDEIIASLLSPVFSDKSEKSKGEGSEVEGTSDAIAAGVVGDNVAVTVGPLKGGARSVAITIENRTSDRLYLKDKAVSSGMWSLAPPSSIPSGGVGLWITESDKYLQGTQGAVILASDLVKGDFYLKWHNPYAGKCEVWPKLVETICFCPFVWRAVWVWACPLPCPFLGMFLHSGMGCSNNCVQYEVRCPDPFVIER